MNKRIQSSSRNGNRNERSVRGGAPEVRGERGMNAEDNSTREDPISDVDLEQILRDEFDSNVLPTPPAIPGWHLCWLTTSSTYDSLQRRLRIGYQPVKRAELLGFDPSNGQKLASYEDYVTCNEMLLCKIPQVRYEQMMRYYHHTRPAEEEGNIVNLNKQVTDHPSQHEKGAVVMKDIEGPEEMERSVRHAQRVEPSFN